MVRKNLFIVLEGLDGSGKSTIAKMLRHRLQGKLYQTPSGYYRKIKKLVDNNLDVVEHLFFCLASIRYASAEIKKLLRVKTVICDRYIYSTLAYHKVLGANINIDIETLKLLMPDIVFYLEISEKTQRDRILKKLDKTFADTWIMRQNVFDQLDREFKKFPVHIINAEVGPEEIVNQILDFSRKVTGHA